MLTVENVVTASPGIIALIGAAVGYGRLMQRMSAVESDVHELKGLNETVARIDERTKAGAEDMKAVRADLSSIVGSALEMIRSYAPRQTPPRR